MSNRPKRQVPSSTKVSAARDSGGGGTPAWVWIAIGAVVVVAGVLAVVLTSGSSSNTGTDDDGNEVELIVYGAPTVEGEALPPFGGGGADAAVGLPAPAVQGQDFEQDPVALTPGDGTAKVVGFLAHWCPHCQAEVPRLTEWFGANPVPDGVEVYGVATASDPSRSNYPPGAWLNREGWPVQTLVDDEAGTIASAYGLSGFPYFVAMDADGNVVARASGELDEAAWEQLLAAAAGGTDGDITGGPSSPQ